MNKIIAFVIFLLTINSIYSFGQPNYKITLAGKSSGTITLDEIINAKRITIDNDSIKITSYSLTALQKGFLVEIAVKSDSFSDKCYSVFSEMKEGNKFFIENIKGMTKSGRTFYLGSLAFKLAP